MVNQNTAANQPRIAAGKLSVTYLSNILQILVYFPMGITMYWTASVECFLGQRPPLPFAINATGTKSSKEDTKIFQWQQKVWQYFFLPLLEDKIQKFTEKN